MSEIDWTAVIISIFGGGGFLATIYVATVTLKKPGTPRDVEDKAVERVSTPAAPGNDSHTVKGLISLANEVGNLSRKVEKQESELGEFRKELKVLRRSYDALYWAWQRIITDWDEIKEQPDPPKLPTDIHHPGAH